MKQWKSFLFIAFVYSIFYMLVGVYQMSLGIRYYEALFISDKMLLLLGNNHKTLELINLIYPLLTHLLAIPPAFIDSLRAPLFTSSIGIALFASYVIVKLHSRRLKFASGISSIYFLCSPMLLFAATSGTSFYLYLVLFFIFFHFIFRYSRQFTVYNLIMLSLCISAFIFLDYQILWIFIFTIPLFALLSLFNHSPEDLSYVGVYSLVTQSRTNRRYYLVRFFSSLTVVYFLPTATLVLYFIINLWLTGNHVFFEISETSQWNLSQFYNATDTNTLGLKLLEYAAYLSPLFLILLLTARRRIIVLSALVIVPLWVVYSCRVYTGQQLFLTTLVLLPSAGIACYIHLCQTKLLSRFRKSPTASLLTFIIFSLMIVGEYYYFQNTENPEEQNMLSLLKVNPVKTKIPAEDMATYISTHLTNEDRILADNKIFYPTMALSRKSVLYIDQFTEDFILAIQFPEFYADYLLVSKASTVYHPKDLLVPVLKNPNFKIKQVYTNLSFRLYKIMNTNTSSK